MSIFDKGVKYSYYRDMGYSKRYLSEQVKHDLSQKMVFLGGPRQVGKTTLAKQLLGPNPGYLNWDIPEHREAILKRQFPDSPLWVFDELHKYKTWRNYLKGIYDKVGQERKILVTGSARLDLYRRGGDSLQGRYHYLRLHPLSVAELNIATQSEFEQLLRLGGFPEPFFRGQHIEAKRWSREYRQRLIHEDLVSLETVKDLGNLELLMLRLPDLVGSPLSINALKEDLQVNHKTLSRWLDIFCQLYAIFRLSPFGAPVIRAVKKEQKHYHFDWSLVEQDGPLFENLVAVHLLKWVHFEQDTKARELDLRYFRDTDGREIDFVVVEKRQPILAVECKWNDAETSKSLLYFKKKFPHCEAWQLSAKGSKHFVNREGIHHAPAWVFLKNLV